MSAIVLSVEYQVGGRAEPTVATLRTAFERAGAEVAKVDVHVLPRLVPLLESETARQFDAQGAGPVAGSWAPLSVEYAKWKEAHYPGRPILVLTGKLRDALTNSSSPNAQRDVANGGLAFGTRAIPYASVHQTGGSKLPARPPFDFGDSFAQGMKAVAADGIRAAVREVTDGLLDFEGQEFEGLPVLTGRNGGRYVESGGKRTYLKRTAAGQVVKRQYGGKRGGRR